MRRGHRFSFRLFLGMFALLLALFAAHAAVDVAWAAAHAGRPAAEVFATAGGSAAFHAGAGGALARAGYCMLGMCMAIFLLAVPLAANFYTSKLIEAYLTDPVNVSVFALGILASANTHFHALLAGSSIHPTVAGTASVALVAVGWAVILPYALYAWRFLTPEVLLEREERAIERDLLRAARPIGPDRRRRAAARVRQTILDLANMVLRAADRADRDLALDGVRTLGRAYTFYLDLKPVLPADWFEPEREWFAGLSEDAFLLVRRERTWVGHLLLHQLWLAYAAALEKIPDAAGEISTVALGVAGEAARHGDRALLRLGLRFANTFLREAIKRADVATVQDVLRVHRAMLARVAAAGGSEAAPEVAEEAEHVRYYHAFARAIGARESADALALALARIVEMAAAEAPRVVLPAVDALERLEPGGPAIVKARALAAAALEAAGRRIEAARLRDALAAAPASERAEVRAALVAAVSRASAGREAFGTEPALEFVAEPRRSAMIALLEG